jgi:hypothetical protein
VSLSPLETVLIFAAAVAALAGAALLAIRLAKRLGGPHNDAALAGLVVLSLLAIAADAAFVIGTRNAGVFFGFGALVAAPLVRLSESAGATWSRLAILGLGVVCGFGLLALFWLNAGPGLSKPLVLGVCIATGLILAVVTVASLRKILGARPPRAAGGPMS